VNILKVCPLGHRPLVASQLIPNIVFFRVLLL